MAGNQQNKPEINQEKDEELTVADQVMDRIDHLIDKLNNMRDGDMDEQHPVSWREYIKTLEEEIHLAEQQQNLNKQPTYNFPLSGQSQS